MLHQVVWYVNRIVPVCVVRVDHDNAGVVADRAHTPERVVRINDAAIGRCDWSGKRRKQDCASDHACPPNSKRCHCDPHSRGPLERAVHPLPPYSYDEKRLGSTALGWYHEGSTARALQATLVAGAILKFVERSNHQRETQTQLVRRGPHLFVTDQIWMMRGLAEMALGTIEAPSHCRPSQKTHRSQRRQTLTTQPESRGPARLTAKKKAPLPAAPHFPVPTQQLSVAMGASLPEIGQCFGPMSQAALLIQEFIMAKVPAFHSKTSRHQRFITTMIGVRKEITSKRTIVTQAPAVIRSVITASGWLSRA
jgi:hypothetical protein